MSINRITDFRLFEVNSSIVEWDIRRAGLNLLREYQLLPQEKIDSLCELEKREADIKIGKLQINDKVFSSSLEQAFTDIMNQFMEENDIDPDYDTLSIKKDACFIINRRIKKDSFGEFIRFIPKNEYHAYLRIQNFEFYFGKGERIDIKGLCGDKARLMEIMSLHENGILNFLLNVVHISESTGMNQKKLNQFLHSFVEMYKRRELDFEYYREFTPESKYRYQFLGGEMMTENIDEQMFDKVNIEWNYKHLILPLINIVC